jgi:hypothetical protein
VDTLRVFTLNVMTTSLGEVPVTRTTIDRPASTERREARRWIERQLRWERTLGALRHRRTHPVPTGKAA